jgi:hypothetical protein
MIPYNEDKKQVKLIDGSIVERISYKPLIGWADNTKPETEAWGLDYRGNWNPLLRKGQKTSLLISATVKY